MPDGPEEDVPENEADLGEALRKVFNELEPLCEEHRRRVLSAVAVLLGLEE